jgi:hypothetical protein
MAKLVLLYRSIESTEASKMPVLPVCKKFNVIGISVEMGTAKRGTFEELKAYLLADDEVYE